MNTHYIDPKEAQEATQEQAAEATGDTQATEEASGEDGYVTTDKSEGE